MRRYWILIVGLLLPAYAFSGRPLNTEDAAVAGKGVVQIEFSWDVFHYPHALTDHTPLLVPIYGLTSRLDVMLDIPYTFRQTPEGNRLHGWNDVVVSAKYLIVSGSRRLPALATLVSLKTRTGDERQGLGSGALDGAVILAATYTHRRWTGHGMLGWILVGNDADQVSLGAAGEYRISPTLSAVAELTADQSPGQLRQGVFSAMFGLYYTLSPRAVLDLGIRRGIDNHRPIWHLTVGTSLTL
ncbi:MAG: hypothetical protein D6681_22660 [Calditrichaeota bacterium]|nr:MAG: hypothetical protein D6681_22660 [Calditrichota bacterium]